VLLLLQQARQFMHLPSGCLSKLTKLWYHRMFKHSVCIECQSFGIITCLLKIWPITTKSFWFAASYGAQHCHNVLAMGRCYFAKAPQLLSVHIT